MQFLFIWWSKVYFIYYSDERFRKVEFVNSFYLLAYLGVRFHFRESVNNLKRVLMQKYILFFSNKCKFCSVDGDLSTCNQLILLTQCSLVQLSHKLTEHLGQKKEEKFKRKSIRSFKLSFNIFWQCLSPSQTANSSPNYYFSVTAVYLCDRNLGFTVNNKIGVLSGFL